MFYHISNLFSASLNYIIVTPDKHTMICLGE